MMLTKACTHPLLAHLIGLQNRTDKNKSTCHESIFKLYLNVFLGIATIHSFESKYLNKQLIEFT